MRGLLEKDFRLLGQQKRNALLFLVVAISISFTMDSTFLVSYISMIGVLLVLSTISYDSYDNGMSFLMTLPFDAKTYAVEKYVISLLGLSVCWGVSVLLQFATLLVKKETAGVLEILKTDLLFLPLFGLIIALTIPVDLKFGTEKGRIIILVFFGVVTVLMISGKRMAEYIFERMGWNMDMILGKLSKVPGSAYTLAAFAAVLMILMLSMLYSINTMKKKEF